MFTGEFLTITDNDRKDYLQSEDAFILVHIYETPLQQCRC